MMEPNLQDLTELLAQNPIDLVAVKAWEIRFRRKMEMLKTKSENVFEATVEKNPQLALHADGRIGLIKQILGEA